MNFEITEQLTIDDCWCELDSQFVEDAQCGHKVASYEGWDIYLFYHSSGVIIAVTILKGDCVHDLPTEVLRGCPVHDRKWHINQAKRKINRLKGKETIAPFPVTGQQKLFEVDISGMEVQ